MIIEFKSVNVDQLWAEVGQGSRFSLEDILIQLSKSLDLKEDYKFIHRDRGFVVSKEDAASYFETHSRPRMPMSTEQQLTTALKRIEDLEKQLGFAGQASKEARGPIEAPETDVESTAFVDPLVSPKEESRSDSGGEKMTVEEIQRDLAKDLNKAKGQSFRKIPATQKPRSPVVETV